MEHFMPRLEESLRTGQPPVNLYTWIEDQPETSRFFQEGMIAITRYVKDDVVNRVDLATQRPATARYWRGTRDVQHRSVPKISAAIGGDF